MAIVDQKVYEILSGENIICGNSSVTFIFSQIKVIRLSVSDIEIV